MALAWTVLPIPNEAQAAKTAKSTASHFHPSPFSSAYIGPPNMRPSAVFSRYLMASKPSEYLVAMPKTPVSQHQSTAPGPPSEMAVATPTMLPVPIVAASAVASAPNCDTSPVAPGSRLTDNLMAVHRCRCGMCSRIVRKICVPNNRMIIGQPHSSPLRVVKNSLT